MDVIILRMCLFSVPAKARYLTEQIINCCQSVELKQAWNSICLKYFTLTIEYSSI